MGEDGYLVVERHCRLEEVASVVEDLLGHREVERPFLLVVVVCLYQRLEVVEVYPFHLEGALVVSFLKVVVASFVHLQSSNKAKHK